MVDVTYTYYTDSYFGHLISESEFPEYLKKAKTYISARTCGRANTIGDGDDLADIVKDAICAAADVYKGYTDDDGTEHGVLSSETVGKWSRSYKTSSNSANSVSDVLNEKVYNILSGTDLLFMGVN